MTRWLVDPCLLVLDDSASLESAIAFALRTRELSAHEDVAIGIRSYAWLMDQYTGNWPGSSLKFPIPELTQAVQQLLPQVLLRILYHEGVAYDKSTTPTFIGPPALEPELLSDAIESLRRNGNGIVSFQDNWSPSLKEVAFDEDDIDSALPLHFDLECLALSKELKRILSVLSSFRLRIVGDKFREDISLRIAAECGIQLDSADWIPSEKNKVPRGLAKRWGNLRIDSDIAICITGKIGHETSGIASACGRQLGRQYLEVEFARDIPEVLLELGRFLVDGEVL